MENRTNLTVTDIDAVVRIIDVASSRGAFKGDELSSVGRTRDIFASVLAHIQSNPEESTEQETEAVVE